jgi:uncharacterized protein YndB with AHSA1/START domain
MHRLLGLRQPPLPENVDHVQSSSRPISGNGSKSAVRGSALLRGHHSPCWRWRYKIKKRYPCRRSVFSYLSSRSVRERLWRSLGADWLLADRPIFPLKAGGLVTLRGLQILMVSALCASTADAQSLEPIVSEAIVQAPADAVWALWSTGEGLGSWLAPHVDIDLRLGGLMRTNYSPQGRLGDPSTIENVILSFEPGRMLSIGVAKTPEGFPFPNAIQRMWTVVYLEPVDGDRTRVRVVGLGFGPDEESQRMRAFFQQGNDITLGQLQSHVAGSRM